jgi:uncharacterized membrane protein
MDFLVGSHRNLWLLVAVGGVFGGFIVFYVFWFFRIAPDVDIFMFVLLYVAVAPSRRGRGLKYESIRDCVAIIDGRPLT